MKIASLVSGGVDSSVTIPLLKKQGYNPHIFYIKIGMEDEEAFMDCPSEEDIEITNWIAKKIQLPIRCGRSSERILVNRCKIHYRQCKNGAYPKP